jgi:glycosyltransferase involved in cell wall biosynthesis
MTNTAATGPRLTIGLPAYNNAATLEAAVRSLLAQTLRDFVLVISDDCSPDDTETVARRLAAGDPRIEYIRQPVNLKYGNFRFLLQRARTPYFMWAAGDDHWEPEFAARCIAALESRPDAVLACTRVEFCDASSGRRWLAKGTRAIDMPQWSRRARDYLRAPDDNSRMYGIFRTEPGRLSFPDDTFHAYDWGFSTALLRHGCHLELPTVDMRRDKTPSHRYTLLARADARRFADRWLPIWRMSRWLLVERHIPWTAEVLVALVRLNFIKHGEIVDARWPWLYHPWLACRAAMAKLSRMLGR